MPTAASRSGRDSKLVKGLEHQNLLDADIGNHIATIPLVPSPGPAVLERVGSAATEKDSPAAKAGEVAKPVDNHEILPWNSWLFKMIGGKIRTVNGGVIDPYKA